MNAQMCWLWQAAFSHYTFPCSELRAVEKFPWQFNTYNIPIEYYNADLPRKWLQNKWRLWTTSNSSCLKSFLANHAVISCSGWLLYMKRSTSIFQEFLLSILPITTIFRDFHNNQAYVQDGTRYQLKIQLPWFYEDSWSRLVAGSQPQDIGISNFIISYVPNFFGFFLESSNWLALEKLDFDIHHLHVIFHFNLLWFNQWVSIYFSLYHVFLSKYEIKFKSCLVLSCFVWLDFFMIKRQP